MYHMSIPKISEKELWKRYQQIKPIVTIDGKKYFLREYSLPELSNLSFFFNRYKDRRELVNRRQYRRWRGRNGVFECIHEYKYHGFFKPSVAEVLAQLPVIYVGCIAAFEIIKYPKNDKDLCKHPIAFENGFHVSKVQLYTN